MPFLIWTGFRVKPGDEVYDNILAGYLAATYLAATSPSSIAHPTHLRAFLNIRIQGASSRQSGCQEFCAARTPRSG